jgi:hypothetical protein
MGFSLYCAHFFARATPHSGFGGVGSDHSDLAQIGCVNEVCESGFPAMFFSAQADCECRVCSHSLSDV